MSARKSEEEIYQFYEIERTSLFINNGNYKKVKNTKTQKQQQNKKTKNKKTKQKTNKKTNKKTRKLPSIEIFLLFTIKNSFDATSKFSPIFLNDN